MNWHSYLSSAFALTLLAGCGSAPPSMNPPGDSLPRLAVSGTDIVRADDHAKVTLRGFVFTAGVWFDVPAGSPSGDLANVAFMQSEDDFREINGWGANLAILYLNYRWFADASGYAFVDQVLGWARAHGVYVLPSLVVYPGGGPRGGTTFFQSSALEAQATQFWVDFVKRYHDHTEIVGYDLLNEPQGVTVPEIVLYQTTLIDAVRAAEPDAVIFVEPQWGDPNTFMKIDRPNLVYDAHFYTPLYFSSQLFPWLYGGAMPGGVHYPTTDGSFVTNVIVDAATQVYDPSVPAGTYDWTTMDTTYPIPPGADLAYVKLFSNGDVNATIYFDDIQASVDGSPYALIPNGSFEDQNEVSNDANFWQSYIQMTGTVERTNDFAADGQWSARISKSSAWSHYTTHYGTDAQNNSIFFLGTASGVPVAGKSTLALRWKVRADKATAMTDGLYIMFGTVQRQNYGKTELTQDLDAQVGSRVQSFGAPMLIGEFAACLLGPRPDIADWTSDVMSYANDRGISWAYYHYRDDWAEARRYLGLYNGPYGAPTDRSTVDADIAARVKTALAP